MKHAGVHHVSLNVDDTQKVAEFYVDVLGMKEISRPDFGFPGTWLQCGPQEVHLLQVDDHQAPQGQHFALRVEDIDGAREELIGRGIDVSPINEIPPIARQCFLRDPAGNIVELNQAYPK
ncbi:MAG: lactoylglutathione lyase [bacterium]|nr:lactoylglutathione lyase [bacterium]